MIYSVHGYYRKISGRKAPAKIEALVFATTAEAAQRLVETLFDGYPAELQDFSVSGGVEKTVQEIYLQRPELAGIAPERGYIYNRMIHMDCIRKYFK